MSLRHSLVGQEEKSLANLEQLVDLFMDWNGKLNLSSLRERRDVEIKHVVDSLMIRDLGLPRNGQRVLDLGTGGGFPGLPLAICFPRTEFVLVDATQKKVVAVSAMARELGLKNVRCVQGRAEELGHMPEYRERFDLVVARALAGFSTLLEYSLPFVQQGGLFVAYQGPEIADRLDKYSGVAKKLGGTMLGMDRMMLPSLVGERYLVKVEKTRSTPKQYPRRTGIPKKEPLL